MSNRDILAIGTSAGGVEALLFLAAKFPPAFPAAVLITIHLPSRFRSSLDQILSNNGPLPASFARDGERPRKGHIYLAPPDRHLLLDGNALSLGTGPRENNVRPAIDPMLRSAALCCGGRLVGVVLTGTQGDGASGLWAVGECGGMTVVQDPRDAAFAEMPQSALARVAPDHLVGLRQMPPLLQSLVHQPAEETRPAPDSLRFEVAMARAGASSMETMDRLGRRSVMACPDCHGVMWEFDEGELTHYRCHVGHTYTAELLSLALDENLRRALGSAQRAMEERVALAHKLHRQARQAGHQLTADTWAARALEYEQEMQVIRESIRRMEAITASEAKQAAK